MNNNGWILNENKLKCFMDARKGKSENEWVEMGEEASDVSFSLKWNESIEGISLNDKSWQAIKEVASEKIHLKIV
ncbi:CLUMA_CG014791, isoform A [Clunio marinus]|uniref:CLUMA_CG014791, isoform A n=1 Tax=Clunio marinus TaxID=568069 RepID=A0A1J1IMX7_9DIPT|nr:CLUMA_CG014791, isoform A [Clunio marinus]